MPRAAASEIEPEIELGNEPGIEVGTARAPEVAAAAVGSSSPWRMAALEMDPQQLAASALKSVPPEHWATARFRHTGLVRRA